MQILFLDDSARDGLIGMGGFALDAAQCRNFSLALRIVKKRHKVHTAVELKWSPPRDHFLRTEFAGKREDLNRDAISLLETHGATVFAAVHVTSECHGPKDYGWDHERTRAWAFEEQLKYLAERFQRPFLEGLDDIGLIICDEFHRRADEGEIIQNFSSILNSGTQFARLDRLVANPLTASSINSDHLQIADLVSGVVVGGLVGSSYAIDQMPGLFERFLLNPFTDETLVACTYTRAVTGYGIKVFPGSQADLTKELLEPYNSVHHVTMSGIVEGPFGA